MIDLHSHILPGIDDGAADIDESLAIARELESNGVSHVFATPHVMKGSYNPTRDQIYEATALMNARLSGMGRSLVVMPGAENYPDPVLPSEYRMGQLTTLGGSDYLLVEAPGVEITETFEELLFQIALAGAVVVLAHPERNSSFSRDIARLEALSERGVYLQINMGSLFGKFGRRALACAEQMCRRQIVAFLGSDAHSVRDATGVVRDALSRVKRLGGHAALNEIQRCEQQLMSSLKLPA